jgi:hypothetical protein
VKPKGNALCAGDDGVFQPESCQRADEVFKRFAGGVFFRYNDGGFRRTVGFRVKCGKCGVGGL